MTSRLNAAFVFPDAHHLLHHVVGSVERSRNLLYKKKSFQQRSFLPNETTIGAVKISRLFPRLSRLFCAAVFF